MHNQTVGLNPGGLGDMRSLPEGSKSQSQGGVGERVVFIPDSRGRRIAYRYPLFECRPDESLLARAIGENGRSKEPLPFTVYKSTPCSSGRCTCCGESYHILCGHCIGRRSDGCLGGGGHWLARDCVDGD